MVCEASKWSGRFPNGLGGFEMARRLPHGLGDFQMARNGLGGFQIVWEVSKWSEMNCDASAIWEVSKWQEMGSVLAHVSKYSLSTSIRMELTWVRPIAARIEFGWILIHNNKYGI